LTTHALGVMTGVAIRPQPTSAAPGSAVLGNPKFFLEELSVAFVCVPIVGRAEVKWVRQWLAMAWQ